MGLMLLLPESAARAETIDQGVITGSSVALRKEANGKSAVLTRLPLGYAVEILETNVNAEWHKVKAKGYTGYVNRVYVSVDPSLDAYKFACTGTIANCEEYVNVRSKPDAGSSILGKAEKGAQYEIAKQNAKAGWHAVKYDGKTGYIASQYLELTPKASDTQLIGLTVTGGTLSPAFAPGEYGYVVVAESDKVTIKAKANDGVKLNVDGTGHDNTSFSMKKPSSRTVRISLNGKVTYSLYIVKDALIVGQWNIKRGNNRLVQQARLIENQRPDVLSLQEVYKNPAADSKIDNMASLKTKLLKHEFFSPTLSYQNGSAYGVGILSGCKLLSSETIPLTSLDKEPRCIQHVEFLFQGKKISYYNTHFSYESSAIRVKQFAETLSIFEKDKAKYKILTGDFNARPSEFDKIQGYRVLNGDDAVFYGYDGEVFKKTTVDNIIVSKAFTVLNVRMIDTKLSDHKPLFAYLRLD